MIGPFQGEYRWLSNFWPVAVQLSDGPLVYPTVEHAYQAAKSTDPNVRVKMANCYSPGQAKRYGKLIAKRQDWEQVKLVVMRKLLEQKFQRPDLKSKLLATWGQEIIEINYWNDLFWGVCGGKGENHLGRLIMEIRMNLMKNGRR